MDTLLPYLSEVASRTLLQLLLLVGPMLVLGLVMHVLAGFVESRSGALVGRRVYLALFGWPGTLVHEAGHAVFCPLFGHRVTAFHPFSPDPQGDVLGYVEHAWNRRNPWALLGNFFIGTGPVILGTLVVYAASRFLLGTDLFPRTTPVPAGVGSEASFGTVWDLVSSAGATVGSTLLGVLRFENLGRWQFWMFLYLAFSIGTAIRLSPSDLKGATSGFVVLAAVLLVVNLATAWVTDLTDPLLKVLAPVIAVFVGQMAFSLAFLGLFALLLWGLTSLLHSSRPGSQEA